MLFIFVVVAFYSRAISSSNKYEKITYLSSDSIIIEARLWFATNCLSEILVIDVNPCLVNVLPPDSSNIERFDLFLRQKLIEKGVLYFEFSGRNDHVFKYGRSYPSSTYYTKSQDLGNAIKYIRSRNDLKNKKIVLIGQSEGGMTSAIVASMMQVDGIVLLSTPGVSGEKFMRYQRLCKDSLFMQTFGLEPNAFEMINNLSSLKVQNYERSYAGFHQFIEETYGPLEEIVHLHNDYDSVATYVMKYLTDKWSKEDLSTRNRHKDFNNYCKAHKHYAYIQPEQIALYWWNPEFYFPKVKCPVFAIYGDMDRNLEFSSSINNILKLLTQGGNNNFTSIVLKGYNHLLETSDRQINKESAGIVVDWILNQ